MKKTILSTLVSAALVAAAATSVLAQAGGPRGQGPALSGAEGSQARHHAQRQHDGKREFPLPSERVESRLTRLKSELKITDAQQAQWDAFAATLRKHARETDKRVQAARTDAAGREKSAQPTAIDRMERGQERLAAAYTRQAETLAAAKPLYAALSPEQQKIADDLLTPRRHGMSRHGGGRPRA